MQVPNLHIWRLHPPGEQRNRLCSLCPEHFGAQGIPGAAAGSLRTLQVQRVHPLREVPFCFKHAQAWKVEKKIKAPTCCRSWSLSAGRSCCCHALQEAE